ncbi:MAG: hypothetical protein DRP45_03960 [Candidatus Zixiibacteriota bacterium]|nr:MAG: hypothetical protein DRP45_03960 [candidate division Zixibacteria bacterium]
MGDSNQNDIPSHHGVGETGTIAYPNETIRLLLERSTCRSFTDRKVPPEILRQVLEAGDHAATGGNLQPYSIIKVENAETRKKLAEWNSQDFIATAPVNLMFCLDWRRLQRWAELEDAPFTATASFRHFWISFQDCIIAAQNICTAADAMDLGSVYIGTVTESIRKTCELLELPQGVFPVVLLCIGYPKRRPAPRKKLGVDTIVHNEKYHELPDDELLRAFDRKYPDLKVEPTDERLDDISRVCRKVHSQGLATRCIEKIRRRGYISPVQRYFGLHYTADLMPERNTGYLKIMEERGFTWFKEYSSAGEGTE